MIYLMNPDDMFQVLLSAPALQCRKHLTPRHFHGNFRRVAECIAFRTGSSLLSRKSRIPLQMLQASARLCQHCWSMPRESYPLTPCASPRSIRNAIKNQPLVCAFLQFLLEVRTCPTFPSLMFKALQVLYLPAACRIPPHHLTQRVI